MNGSASNKAGVWPIPRASASVLVRGVIVLLVFATTACGATTEELHSGRDLYAETLADFTGPTLFPAVKPPQLDFVTLTIINGQEFLDFQHRDIHVRVCSPPQCGENARTLRTVEVGLEPTMFNIAYAGTGQMSTPDPVLNAELTEFWNNVEFVPERPDWLTMDLWPGG